MHAYKLQIKLVMQSKHVPVSDENNRPIPNTSSK